MPQDLIQPMILAFIAAIGIVAYELRASLEAPVCAQCVHCRLLAAERKEAEEQAYRWRSGRVGGAAPDDRDHDEHAPKR